MNGELVAEQSAALTTRLLAIEDEFERLNRLFETVYSRLPDDAESVAIHEFIDSYSSSEGEPESESVEHAAWKAVCRGMLSSNEFYFID